MERAQPAIEFVAISAAAFSVRVILSVAHADPKVAGAFFAGLNPTGPLPMAATARKFSVFLDAYFYELSLTI